MKYLKEISYSVVIVIVGVCSVFVSFLLLLEIVFIVPAQVLHLVNNWVVSTAVFLLMPLAIGWFLTSLLFKKFDTKRKWLHYLIILFALYLIIFNSGLFNRNPDHSPETRRLSDVRQLASALELYKNDFKAYPASLQDLVPTYISKIPGPRASSRGSACKKPEDTLYRYERFSNEDFNLQFCLGDDMGGYKAGVRVLTPEGIK